AFRVLARSSKLETPRLLLPVACLSSLVAFFSFAASGFAQGVPGNPGCPTNKTVECGSPWTFDDPTSSGLCSVGTNITVSVITTVTNMQMCSSTVTRTWQVFDDCGTGTTCIQMVTIVDTSPPIVSCANDKTVQCGS